MPSYPSDRELELFLKQSDSLRLLARRLLLDEHRAEDVVQQVWLAFLERPPITTRGLGAWLHGAVRHVALHTRRRERERPERERVVARDERAEEVAELADLELRRLVLDALSELEPTYRSALYQRYLEGCTPNEIAARQGVPVASVKTRLRRALQLLRARMEQRTKHDTRAWIGPLVALADLERTSWWEALQLAWRAQPSVARTLAAAATLLISLGALTGWLALRGATEPTGDGALALESARPAGPAVVAAVAAPNAPARAPAASGVNASATVVGRVLDPRGAPVVGARVLAPERFGARARQQVSSLAQAGAPLVERAEEVVDAASALATVTDADGRFALTGALEGRALAVRAEGMAWLELALPAQFEPPLELGQLSLAPEVAVVGRVLDAAGLPVAKARLLRPVVQRVGEARFELGGAWGEPVAVSDAAGEFRVGGLSPGPWWLSVDAPGHAQARVEGDAPAPGEHALAADLTLERGRTIRGRVSTGGAGLAADTWVRAVRTSSSGSMLRERTTRLEVEELRVPLHADGAFELGPFGAGPPLALRAERRRSDGRFEPLGADVRASAGDQGVVVPLAPKVSLAVRVLDAHSADPLGDVRVELVPELAGGGGDDSSHVTLTDGDGRAALEALALGRAHLALSRAGFAATTTDLIPLNREGPRALTVSIERAAELALRIVDAAGEPIAGLELMAVPGGRARTDADGRARFGGLPSGAVHVRWVNADADRPGLLAWRGPDAAHAPTATVAPGEHATLELALDRSCRVAGRVRMSGAALAGAEVSVRDLPGPDDAGRLLPLEGSALLTGADGRFELRGLSPGDVRLSVAHADLALPFQQELVLTQASASEHTFELAGESLFGLVHDADGRPLSDVRVEVVRARSWRADARGAPATSDANGRYALRGLPTGEPLIVALDRPGSATAFHPMTLAPGGEHALESTLLPEAQVRVRLGARHRERRRELYVELTPERPDDHPVPPRAAFDAQGAALLSALPAGRWTITLSPLAGEEPIAAGELETRAGELTAIELD